MSHELSSRLPTDRPDALKSFVEGRQQFNVYLTSGSSSELEEACRLFEDAANTDPNFDLAVFYHALTKAELRDSDTAIEELQILVKKGVTFLAEAYLHLAYAHAKRYRDDEFYKAEEALDRATVEAEKTGEKEVEPIIGAYRVFLYSVMGGRLSGADAQQKIEYLDKAIRLGEVGLRTKLRRRDPRSASMIKLELHNALGIAYMWKGMASEAFSKQQERLWSQATKHFQAALDLGVNPVRVHQNIGTLLRLRGRQFRARNAEGDRERAEDCYRQSAQEYEVSIAINPLDQFPHYELARLYARQGQWELARERLMYGRRQKGAVKPASWDRLERAVEMRDASILDEV